MPGRRQDLAVAVALVVVGSLLIEFWLGASFDRGTLSVIQGAWVGGVFLGAWLRRRFGRRTD